MKRIREKHIFWDCHLKGYRLPDENQIAVGLQTAGSCQTVSLSVLAFGELQVELRAFAVDEHSASVDNLLASAVVASEAAHHSDREEKLHRLGLVVAVFHVDDAAEIHTIEVDVTGEKVKQWANQVGNVIIESQRC